MNAIDAPVLLKSAAECARLIELMDEALLALGGKRRTLEERAISDYFAGLVIAYAEIIAFLHMKLDQAEPLAQALTELGALNAEFSNDVNELLKAIRHNYNYLEQYFEYDYYSRLSCECAYAVRLDALKKKLHDSSSAGK